MNSNQNLRNNNNNHGMNKFGTSDNFQTGSYQIANTGPKRPRKRGDIDIYDNRTDGFNHHNAGRGPSPIPNQFTSDPGD